MKSKKDILKRPVKVGDLIAYCEHPSLKSKKMLLRTGNVLNITNVGVTVKKDNKQGYKSVKEFVLIKGEPN